MAARLTKAQARTLRRLAEKPAHELRDSPLETLTDAVRNGWATSRQYTSFSRNGRAWRSYETTITTAGLAALAEDGGGEP